MGPAAAAFDGIGGSPELRADIALRLAAPISDLVLVLDGDGFVRSVSGARSSSLAQQAVDWKGRRWIDLLSRDARPAAGALVEEARRDGVSRVRAVVHAPSAGLEWTLECCVAVFGAEGGSLVIGRDARGTSTLEARLAELQQTLERDYLRMRHAESRYRLLFETAREAVLLIDPDSRRIEDANAAADQLLGPVTGELVGSPVASCFEPRVRVTLDRALVSARATGGASRLWARLAPGGGLHRLSVSTSRADDAILLIVHTEGAPAEQPGEPPLPSFGALVEGLPDAVVLGDDRGVVRVANPAFAALVGLERAEQAAGRMLGEWLERPEQGIAPHLALLRHDGRVIDAPVLLRDAHGPARWALLSAARIAQADSTWVVFVLRAREPVADGATAPLAALDFATDAERLSSLVGLVSLPRLVRDATSRVERGFLDAALERAAGNRTTAAELLGISRQSLYTKIRRHGLVAAGPDPAVATDADSVLA